MNQPVHREVHYWIEEMTEPPCGTLEDRFDWSDAIEDVTCVACQEALAGDGGRLDSSSAMSPDDDSAPAP